MVTSALGTALAPESILLQLMLMVSSLTFPLLVIVTNERIRNYAFRIFPVITKCRGNKIHALETVFVSNLHDQYQNASGISQPQLSRNGTNIVSATTDLEESTMAQEHRRDQENFPEAFPMEMITSASSDVPMPASGQCATALKPY